MRRYLHHLYNVHGGDIRHVRVAFPHHARSHKRNLAVLLSKLRVPNTFERPPDLSGSVLHVTKHHTRVFRLSAWTIVQSGFKNIAICCAQKLTKKKNKDRNIVYAKQTIIILARESQTVETPRTFFSFANLVRLLVSVSACHKTRKACLQCRSTPFCSGNSKTYTVQRSWSNTKLRR